MKTEASQDADQKASPGVAAVMAVLRAYPLYRFRRTLIRLLPDVPRTSTPIRTRSGDTIRAFSSGGDHISKYLYWFGEFDPWINSTLIRLTRPGEIFVDVGANLGDTTIPLARYLGPSGKVYCFEPAPVNVQRLNLNVSANGLENIEIVQIALSDKDAILQFEVPLDQPGMARVACASGSGTYEVPATTFDNWAAQRHLGNVSVCKIDVEGHEAAVFAGMSDSLRRRMIGALVFEHHKPFVGSAIASLFEVNGYTVHRIFRGWTRPKIGPLNSTDACATTDYVAVRDQEFRQRLFSVKNL